MALKSKGGNKISVSVINNVKDLTLELVTQSAGDLFDKVSGRFEGAPDPFIPEGSASAFTSIGRDNAMAGNVNCVVYKESGGSTTLLGGKYLVIAWDHPLAGNAHYYIDFEKPEDGLRGLLKKVVESNHTGVRDPSWSGVRAYATFASENLKVVLSPI